MVGVQEQLEILVQLQAIDLFLDSLLQEQQGILERMEAGKARLRQHQQVLREKTEVQEGLVRHRRQGEIEFESKSEDLKKLQARLYEVKTNKEYQAMQVEIGFIRDARVKLEEEILTDLVQEDDVKQGLAELQQSLTVLERELAKVEEEQQKELQTIESESSAKRAEREGVAGHIDRAALATYEKIREGRGGVAVAGIQDGVCAECHMSVRPQLLIEISKHKELMLCDSCTRILHI